MTAPLATDAAPTRRDDRAGPPRPNMVLQFGITGHRPNRLKPEAVARLPQDFASLFQQSLAVMQDIWRTNGEFFSTDAPRLRLISALAEGSDRIAALAASNAGLEIACPIPFARDEYAKDFATAQSKEEFHALLARAATVLEFPSARASDAEAERAYEAAGLITLRQCDILLAVWDGKPPSGRGGTAEVVFRALDARIPVIWFCSEGVSPPRLLCPSWKVNRDSWTNATEELNAASLTTLLKSALEPPPDAGQNGHGPMPPLARLRDYFAERMTRFTTAIAYHAMLMALFVRRLKLRDMVKRALLEETANSWRIYWDKLPKIAPISRQRLGTILQPRFAWADGLATRYGQLHRSSYVISFAFAAAAVSMGVAELFGGPSELVFVSFELVFIVLIATTVGIGRQQRWHERWVDYRHLAELLRHMRILALTGSSTMEMRTAHHEREIDRDPGAAWVNWYYRATVREIGMVGASPDHVYCVKIASLLQTTEIVEQWKYHSDNEVLIERIDYRLELIGTSLFVLTALICVSHLVNHFVPLPEFLVSEALVLASALFPAIGAACFGIRVHGEFSRIAHRSHMMKQRLGEMMRAIEQAETDPNVSLASVAHLSETATHIMMLDVSDWRSVFREKPLSLPA